MSDEMTDDEKVLFTLALVEQCVRNTSLEDLHAGLVPGSKTGDFSDMKVVTPFGEIPWTRVSRISDEEMKALMIEVTNRVFTFLPMRRTCWWWGLPAGGTGRSSIPRW